MALKGEKKKEWSKRYLIKNREKLNAYMRDYRKTAYGRAIQLSSRYSESDKEAGRGECTLTAQWIVENIFTKPCAHCGKTGWEIIGCNRIDNSLPHTPDNVEPCCFECNIKLAAKELERDELGRWKKKNPVN